MKKQTVLPISVLATICVVVALILGGANELTKGKIKENALKKEQASLIEVLPESTIFEELNISGYEIPKTVKSAYRESADRGYVLIMETATEYSAENMTVSVGIYPSGEVAGVSLTNYKESKDFGKSTYPQKFVGKTADNYNEVEITAGVTVSSNAFKGLIGDAIKAAQIIEENRETVSLMNTALPLSEENSSGTPREDAELYLLVNKLVGEKEFNTAPVPNGAPEYLKRLYKVSRNDGYVAYIAVPGEYVPIATEGLVYIGANGKIKDINLLSWIVGHGVGYGDFPERFIGKDAKTVNGVELVSTATYTSGDFRAAVSSIFPYIPHTFPIWRAVGIGILALSLGIFVTAMIISKKRRTAA